MATANVIPHNRRDGERLRSWLQFRFGAVRDRLAPLAPGLVISLGVFGCTWVSFRLGQSSATVGFLYLVCVVLAAVYGGFWQATFISVISVACLDYFFDEPIFSFTVGRVSNWVELSAFEFTALIISRLSNRVQLRALEAEAERRDTARLYQTARRLLLLDCSGDPGNPVTSLIRETFDLQGVVLFDGVSGSLYKSGAA